MKTLEILLPDELSDEVVAAFCDVLHELATACDSHYLAQILRHRQQQCSVPDPDHPWRSPPSDL